MTESAQGPPTGTTGKGADHFPTNKNDEPKTGDGGAQSAATTERDGNNPTSGARTTE